MQTSTYFLVLYFHHSIADYVTAYYVEQSDRGHAIYSKMIELDGEAIDDDKPKLDLELTKVLVNGVFLGLYNSY